MTEWKAQLTSGWDSITQGLLDQAPCLLLCRSVLSLLWCSCDLLYKCALKYTSKLIWGLKMYIRKKPNKEIGTALWS